MSTTRLLGAGDAQPDDRSRRRPAPVVAACIGVVLALLVAGCGGKKADSSEDGDGRGGKEASTSSVESTSLGDDGKTPKRGGTLRYALAARVHRRASASPRPSWRPASPSPWRSTTVCSCPMPMASRCRTSPSRSPRTTTTRSGRSTIRPGITFHDGSKLDAQIVKDNLDGYRGAYRTRKPLLFTFYFEPIEAVTVVDPMTVRVDTKVPWVAFPSYLASGRVGIMAHAQLDDEQACDRNLIGTGPFVLEAGDSTTRWC